MSKRNKKRLRFLGEPFTSVEFNSLISLIQMTSGRLRVHKKDFATEEMFWTVIETITGLRKRDRETLQSAVCRICVTVKNNGLAWRDIRIAAVDPQAIRAMFKNDPRHSETIETFRPQPKHIQSFISKEIKGGFYKSWDWRTLRMEAIQKYGRSCQCCGAGPGQKDTSGTPVRICVDHIKPISKRWDLRLDLSNLQILCDECNMGKGNWSETDFRAPDAPDEWIVEDGIPDDIISQLTDRTTGTIQ